jgi:hypothetical protein
MVVLGLHLPEIHGAMTCYTPSGKAAYRFFNMCYYRV